MSWHWLARWLGLLNLTGPIYGWWSGSGSVFLPPLLNGLVFGAVFWWHHQCHVTGCFWYARRTTAAGERACFRHHPHPKRTVEEIHAAHHAARDVLHEIRRHTAAVNQLAASASGAASPPEGSAP